jgi:YfiH family protein
MEWRRDGELEWLEAELPAARVAFSTRRGGVSEGPFAGLNLGILTGDAGDRVVENRRRLASSLGLQTDRIAIGRQLHGTAIASHERPQDPSPYARPGAPIPEVDGHVTELPGLALLVFVADCLPVALAGGKGVAMLHCGWRGLAAGIAQRGAAAVGATSAVIGPGIGPCCYEVGEEVLEAFADLGPGTADGRMLNLREVARLQLEAAGVERVEVAPDCTSCDHERFFSHRRDDGASGRQAGLVWLEPERAGGGR